MNENIKKWLFILLGSISLILAYIGIVLPGIPGTPFILLTAFFFFRSSNKMYQWISKQKIFSFIIKEFNKHDTIPTRIKLLIILPIWISLIVAELFILNSVLEQIIAAIITILCSMLFLLLKIKSSKL